MVDRKRLAETHIPLVRYVAKRWFRSSRDEDLLAAGGLGLAIAAQKYDPAKGPFRLYACYIIRREMIDHLRRSRKIIGIPCDTVAHGVDIEQRMDVRDAVNALPERERRMIRLRYWKGQTILEAARTIGISKNKGFTTMASAKARLWSKLR